MRQMSRQKNRSTATSVPICTTAVNAAPGSMTTVELGYLAGTQEGVSTEQRDGWTIDGVDRPHSLFGMIRNTTETSPTDVLSAYKDNAAVICGPMEERFVLNPHSRTYEFGREQIHILMKVETHNHPTAIAPDPGGGQPDQIGRASCRERV